MEVKWESRVQIWETQVLGSLAYGQSAIEGGRGLASAAPSVSPGEEQKWEKRTAPPLRRGQEPAPLPPLTNPQSSAPSCNSSRTSMISFMTVFIPTSQVVVGQRHLPEAMCLRIRWLSCAPVEGDGDFWQHLDQVGYELKASSEKAIHNQMKGKR